MSWKPIIVGVDASPEAAGAAALGWRIARAAGVHCHLVHAVRDLRNSLVLAQDIEELQRGLLALARRHIESALEGSVPVGLLRSLSVRLGRAPTVLQQAVAEYGAGLVVLGGKHHSALGQWLGGSTVHNTVRGLAVPLLVTAGAPTAKRRVLAAVDLSSAARPAIEEAERFAKLFGGQLRGLHVFEPLMAIPEVPTPIQMAEYEQLTQDHLEREVWPLITYPAADKVVRHGFASEVIGQEAAAWKADLVVVGSHGKGWVDRLLLGSITEHLLNQLPTSLLVVPAPAPVSRETVAAPERRVTAARFAPV